MNKQVEAGICVSSPSFRVWTCGPFRLERGVAASSDDYQPVRVAEWGGSNYPRLLLKALLCCPGRRARREALVDMLWPDLDPEQAVQHLNTATSKLRSVLRPAKGKESLLITEEDASSYKLADQSWLWVDADAALTFLSDAEHRRRTSQSVVPLLEKATSYFNQGMFLEGEEGLWVVGKRATIERARYRCRLWLSDASIQQGMPGQAEAMLSALLEEDPTDEDVLLRLMVLLHRQGMAHQAFRLYSQIHKVFIQEGMEFTEATKSFAALLEKEPHSIPQDSATARNTDSGSLLLQGEVSTSFTIDGISQKSTLMLPTTMVQLENSIKPIILDCPTLFGIQLAHITTLIHSWYGMAAFCHELQDRLDQEIKNLDTLKTHYPLEEYTLSRRGFLTTLAALPTALLTSVRQKYKLVVALEELLPTCSASLTACWHLSGGSQLDAILPLIASYLPILITVCKQMPAYREVAADLVAQIYFLKAILAWHLEGLDAAEIYCIQAMNYSDLTRNVNLRLTALNQHALIAYYSKNFQKALAKSEEADALLREASHEHIFPIVQGRVHMYLAAIQAQQKFESAVSTLEHAQTAFVAQSAVSESVPVYADCGNAPLLLWDGLTHYYLGSHDPGHSKYALSSLSTFGQLKPSTSIPERFRLECLNSRTLVAIQLNELEEAITCFKAGRQGAIVLESKQRNGEIDYAYQLMLKQWPNEERVKKLGSTTV